MIYKIIVICLLCIMESSVYSFIGKECYFEKNNFLAEVDEEYISPYALRTTDFDRHFLCFYLKDFWVIKNCCDDYYLLSKDKQFRGYFLKKNEKSAQISFYYLSPLDILISNETFLSSSSCKGCSVKTLKNALNSIEQALNSYGLLVQIKSTILIYFNTYDDPFNSFYRFSFQSPHNVDLTTLLTQLQKGKENYIQFFSTRNIHHHLEPKNFLQFIQDDLRDNFKNINPKDINILLSLFGFLKAVNYNLPTHLLSPSSDNCQNYPMCKILMDQFMEEKVRDGQNSNVVNFNGEIKYLEPVPLTMSSESDLATFLY